MYFNEIAPMIRHVPVPAVRHARAMPSHASVSTTSASVPREYDGVFEGGGAKGLAFVGALRFMEQQGMWFRRVAGTSAGAITAAFIAAGYKASDPSRGETIHKIVSQKNFADFKDAPPLTDAEVRRSPFYGFLRDVLSVAPLVVPPLAPLALLTAPEAVRMRLFREVVSRNPRLGDVSNLLARGGLYVGEAFRTWINQKVFDRLSELTPANPPSAWPTLKETTDRTGIGLTVIASDIGRRQMIVFNDQLTPNVPVANAVRMSMSIPFFFKSVTYNGCPVVDGGLLSNYPMFLFMDRARSPLRNTPADLARPTIGFVLEEEPQLSGPVASCPPFNPDRPVEFVLDYFQRLANTVMEASDRRDTANLTTRTVRIDARGFGTTQFDLTEAQKNTLASRGWNATAAYFQKLGLVAPAPSPFGAWKG